MNEKTHKDITIDDLIDWVITHPGGNAKTCARQLGLTPRFVTLMRNTDAFKQRYMQRRSQQTVELGQKVTERLAETTLAGLETTHKVLSDPECPGRLAIDGTDKLLERMGYGVKGTTLPPGNTVSQHNVYNFNQVSQETLERARRAMQAAHGDPPVLNPPSEVEDEDAPVVERSENDRENL
jgi:hypothetical protein